MKAFANGVAFGCCVVAVGCCACGKLALAAAYAILMVYMLGTSITFAIKESRKP